MNRIKKQPIRGGASIRILKPENTAAPYLVTIKKGGKLANDTNPAKAIPCDTLATAMKVLQGGMMGMYAPQGRRGR